jgi:general nucleoside transport system permease protein
MTPATPATVEAVPVPGTRAADRSRLTTGVVQIAVGGFALWAFGLNGRTSGGARAIFELALSPNAPGAVGPLRVPAQPVAIALSIVVILCGLARVSLTPPKAVARTITAVYFAAFIVAFLVWAGAGASVGINLPGVIQGTLLAAVPLVLGSLSGVLCERSGVVNIAIEGQFLFGAFAAAMAATMTGSIWAGLVAGCFGGVLMGALLAVFANRYLIEQVVLGVVLNLFASGLTGFLYDQLMASNQSRYNQPPTFQAIRIPGLADIPVIGQALFDNNVIFYAAFLLVPVVSFLLYRTRWGLRTRAVGEHPTAADTVGIKVLGLRYRNVITAGLFAGLGGVWLTIGNVGAFGKDMSVGKGYIALAALIVGRWKPGGALAAAVLFGFASDLNLFLSSLGTPIPSAFISMAPYLATVFVVATVAGVVRAPAADGKPYIKG